MEYISLDGLDRHEPDDRQGGLLMPHYEFYCEKCRKEVSLILAIGQRERGEYKCPDCGGKQLKPLMGTFFSQTSRKA